MPRAGPECRLVSSPDPRDPRGQCHRTRPPASGFTVPTSPEAKRSFSALGSADSFFPLCPPHVKSLAERKNTLLPPKKHCVEQ